jgi:hypothetical protein
MIETIIPLATQLGSMLFGSLKARREAKELERRQQEANAQIRKLNLSSLKKSGDATRSSFPVNGVELPMFKFGGTVNADAIAENDEMVTFLNGILPDTGNTGKAVPVSGKAAKLKGDEHSDPSGGIPIELFGESTIWSDKTKLPTEAIELLKSIGIKAKPSDTFSKAVERIERKRGKIEKMEEGDQRAKNTKKLMSERFDGIEEILAMVQESTKPKGKTETAVPKAEFGLRKGFGLTGTPYTLNSTLEKDFTTLFPTAPFGDTPGNKNGTRLNLGSFTEMVPLIGAAADYFNQNSAINKMVPNEAPVLAPRVSLNKTMDTGNAVGTIERGRRSAKLAASKLRDSQVAAGLSGQADAGATQNYLDLLSGLSNYRLQAENQEAQINAGIDANNAATINQGKSQLTSFKNAQTAARSNNTSNFFTKAQQSYVDSLLRDADKTKFELMMSGLDENVIEAIRGILSKNPVFAKSINK